jgi:hypothetical protein
VPNVVDRLTGILERPRDQHHEARRHTTAYKLLAIVSLIALVLQSSLRFISLFEPPLPYEIADPGSEPLDSAEFLRALAAVSGGWLSDGNAVEVLTNGDQFYAGRAGCHQRAQGILSTSSVISSIRVGLAIRS